MKATFFKGLKKIQNTVKRVIPYIGVTPVHINLAKIG